MTNDLLMMLCFLVIVIVICLTTIIHSILDKMQMRWEFKETHKCFGVEIDGHIIERGNNIK